MEENPDASSPRSAPGRYVRDAEQSNDDSEVGADDTAYFPKRPQLPLPVQLRHFQAGAPLECAKKVTRGCSSSNPCHNATDPITLEAVKDISHNECLQFKFPPGNCVGAPGLAEYWKRVRFGADPFTNQNFEECERHRDEEAHATEQRELQGKELVNDAWDFEDDLAERHRMPPELTSLMDQTMMLTNDTYEAAKMAAHHQHEFTTSEPTPASSQAKQVLTRHLNNLARAHRILQNSIRDWARLESLTKYSRGHKLARSHHKLHAFRRSKHT
jgi:hypothetical protein